MLPFSSISERLEDIARYLAVYAVMMVFFIADIIALPGPFDWGMKIPFMIIAVYFWSIYRPAIMPAVLAFVIGLFIDILSGVPFGFNAVIFVIIQWAISDQRAFLSAQSFPMVWLIFALIYALVMVLQWLVSGLLNLSWVQMSNILPDIGIAVVTFPLIAGLLYLTQKILPNTKMSLSSRQLH